MVGKSIQDFLCFEGKPYPRCLFAFCVGFFVLLGCGSNADAVQSSADVRSYIEGQITLSTEIDSVADFSGFEILVASRRVDGIDTLGFATTDDTGNFSMDIVAPRRGIYGLVIGRDGAVLEVDEIAVAQDDSATLQLEFPFGNRPIMVRSRENAALLGLRNTMSLHQRDMQRLAVMASVTTDDYGQIISQTSELLWNLWESDPTTIAAGLASVESVKVLDGWNDSLIVARTRMLDPDLPEFREIIGTARRAQVRLGGMASAVGFVEEMKATVTNPDNLAMMQSELVLAFRDNMQTQEAIDAARSLKMEYATDTTWIDWADNAIYDLENLSPGMPVPAFEFVDVDGTATTAASFAGRYFILEFYVPGREFEQELFLRNQAYRTNGDAPAFDLLSMSLQPDTLLNEAFFDGRDIPGRHVFVPRDMAEGIVQTYNIHQLPTRFLVDPEGNIVGKYVLGNGLVAFQEAITRTTTN